MLAATDADVALLNSGTLRSDTLHPPGDFTRGHLTAVLPFVDPIVVLRASADDILQSLENSVSKWPTHEGRFAQVGVPRRHLERARMAMWWRIRILGLAILFICSEW